MELLERFAAGDSEAFETLFRQFQGEVFGWIVRMVRDPGVAEELTVETFWKIYRSRARFDAKLPFGAWARRIATNLAIDYLRRRAPEQELKGEWASPPGADAAQQQELRQRIAQAFARLPAKLQAAAMLALVEERPYEEIGQALGISAGAVRVRVFRACRTLRKELSRMGVKP